MKEILRDKTDVCFYELDELEKLPAQIESLLADRECWEKIQRQAYDTAARQHTWSKRAERIHKEILCKIS